MGSMQDDWKIVVAPAVMDARGAIEMVRQVLGDDADVIVDLTGTELLTSDGCEVLVEMHTSLVYAERSVALRVRPSGLVWQVLRITGLDDRFAVLVEQEHEQLQ
jgi:anti-anti-sigma regulatory factor